MNEDVIVIMIVGTTKIAVTSEVKENEMMHKRGKDTEKGKEDQMIGIESGGTTKGQTEISIIEERETIGAAEMTVITRETAEMTEEMIDLVIEMSKYYFFVPYRICCNCFCCLVVTEEDAVEVNHLTTKMLDGAKMTRVQ